MTLDGTLYVNGNMLLRWNVEYTRTEQDEEVATILTDYYDCIIWYEDGETIKWEARQPRGLTPENLATRVMFKAATHRRSQAKAKAKAKKGRAKSGE